MPPRERLNRIHVAFDDYRLVANAWIVLPVLGPSCGPERTGGLPC